MQRRSFLSLLAIGLAGALSGCRSAGGSASQLRPLAPAVASPLAAASAPPLPPVPDPRPGTAKVVHHAPRPTRQIAITIDDGICEECVDGYVAIAEDTGIHLTFAPNGAYRDSWDRHARRLRPLIAAGQVQMMNHTWSHRDMLEMSDGEVRRDIERNEAWIQRVFGVTARPWLRPPFGFHSERTDEVAAEIGYTKVVLWDGSFGDARLLTPAVLLDQARRYLQPGTIMLGHANHPTVLWVFDEIRRLLAERALEPVTLDEMFGTSRARG